jgi:phosphate starvation-inducible PhoH-like protein
MRSGKAGRVVKTTDMVGRERTFHYRTFELPLVGPVQFEPREIPIDPYALGLLLGDGCISGSTTPAFSTGDPELAAALESLLPDVELVHKPGTYDYVIRHIHGRRGRGPGGVAVKPPVTALLAGLGLSGKRPSTKFVPREYLHNSPEVRLAVLQGLLDTDGGPVQQKDRSCRVHYSTTSPRLRDAVIFLVRSLGGVAYSRTRPAAGRPPGRARGRSVPHRCDAYVIDIRLPSDVAPFRLARKVAAYGQVGGGRPMRFIDRVVPDGEEACVCIAVGAPDSLYVTDDFIVTHNTLNNSFIILDEAQNTTPEQMKMFLTRIGFGSKVVVNGDVTQIDLPGGRSGLAGLEQTLSGIDGLAWISLGRRDVVRHRIVADIVGAFEAAEEAKAGRRPGSPAKGQTAADAQVIAETINPAQAQPAEPTEI